MRISDGRSDVCSSDLRTLWFSFIGTADDDAAVTAYPADYAGGVNTLSGASINDGGAVASARRDRQSVVSGKSVSVRVDLGGRRIITNKHTYNKHLNRNINKQNDDANERKQQ